MDKRPMPDAATDDRVRELLRRPCVIALVGMSPRLERPSRTVGLYLARCGFTVIPVHPTAGQIAGLKAIHDLSAIARDRRVEIVDVCVAAERAGNVAEEAAQIGARVVWFQPGAANPAQERRARELGLEVISDRCIMADHRRLLG